MIQCEQLEFRRLVDFVHQQCAASAASRRAGRKIRRIASEDFPVRLNAVLVRENLSFSTYAIMLAIDAAGGTISRAGLALRVGASYHMVRNQILRTPWFIDDHTGPLVAVRLTPEAYEKLSRITAKLAGA